MNEDRRNERHAHPRADSQRGVAFVLVILMMFGIMGMLALAVDMGIVLMTRTQMQTAVDTAALEGLRMRDASRDDTYAQRDLDRRKSASRIAGLVFDADGVISTSELDGEYDDTLGSPIFDVDPGALDGTNSPGDLRRTIGARGPSLDGVGIYKPRLELNLDNEQHGDLVQGVYVGDHSSVRLSEEGKRYFRNDFQPIDTMRESFEDPVADAFLARMRRTNDFVGLDNIDGVSSAGPPLSLMFGNGGLVPSGDPRREYSYRHHGITVRATAIAQARPVLTVGPPVNIDTIQRYKLILGRAPFVLTGKFVKQFRGQGRVRISNSKVKVKVGEGPTGAERKIGWFVPQDLALSVGDKVRERDLVPIQPTQNFEILGYVPILEKFVGERGFPANEETTDWRVIGFGLFFMRGELEETPRGVGGKDIVLRQFRGQLIMPENASAVVMPSFAASDGSGGQLGAKAVELLLQRNDKLARNGLAIWAPALVR